MKPRSVLMFVLVLLQTTGCSVYLAATQPDKKDLSVLNKGTPRTHVIAECGIPLHSEEDEGIKKDIYVFTQGYSGGAKASRAVFHTAADIFTLGLWEIVGTPFEAVVDGTEVKLKVIYDEQERIDRIEVIEGDRKLKDIDSIVTNEEGEEETAVASAAPNSSMEGPQEVQAAPPPASSSDHESQIEQPKPWTGVWKVRSTIDGEWSWHIDQTGNIVNTAPEDDYPMRGVVDGDLLSGWLKETTGSDIAMKLKLAPDIQSFEGQFTDKDITGHLQGTRVE